MLKMNNLSGFGVAASGLILTPISNAYQWATSAVTTFSSMSLGAPYAGREIIAAISYWNGGAGLASITSVTIGGVTATLDLNYGDNTEYMGVCFARAIVPSGTTGNVVVNYSASRNFWTGVQLYNSLNRTVIGGSGSGRSAGFTASCTFSIGAGKKVLGAAILESSGSVMSSVSISGFSSTDCTLIDNTNFGAICAGHNNTPPASTTLTLSGTSVGPYGSAIAGIAYG